MADDHHDPFLTLGNNNTYPADILDNTQMFSKKNRPLKVEESGKMDEEQIVTDPKDVRNLNGFDNDAENDYFFGWTRKAQVGTVFESMILMTILCCGFSWKDLCLNQ